MSDSGHNGFTTALPVEMLKPVEALALVNRWVKLKSYFYYDDLDTLYELKDRKISELVKLGEMNATAIIIRESPVIAAMRSEEKNGGQNLEWLNYFVSVDTLLSEIDFAYFSLLSEMATGLGIEVEYPQDIYERWLEQIKSEIDDYEIAKYEYEREFQRRQPILEEYNRQLNEYYNSKQEAAQQWVKDNKVKIPRSHSGKSLKKDWVKPEGATSSPKNIWDKDLTQSW